MRGNEDLHPDKRSISMQILYLVACVKDYTQSSESSIFLSFFWIRKEKKKLVVKIKFALKHKLADHNVDI
jgi:hypothetical protein